MTSHLLDRFRDYVNEHVELGINEGDETVPYIAPSKLKNYWSEKRVDAILNGYRPPIPHSSDLIIKKHLQIFSILVYIDHPQEISWFCSNIKDRNDNHLPFDAVELPRNCPWTEEFLRYQWRFHPLVFTPDSIYKRTISPRMILPVTYDKKLSERRGGCHGAKLWKVQVHNACNSITPEVITPFTFNNCLAANSQKNEPVVFKVFEGTDADHLYTAETDVYSKLQPNVSKYITKHFACFSFEGKQKSIIVLEYAAGGSLLDFFKLPLQPASPDDLYLLWGRLFKLLNALEVLHNLYLPDGPSKWYLVSVHQDIQPSNILVFPQKDKYSEFDVKFKLTDFGLAEMGRVLNSRGTMATEDRGNMMYISPESYANFFGRDLVKTDVPPTSYIWALGALFSDVLVWSIHGEAGRYKYRQARKKEISRHPQMIAVEYGACFHNGFQRLPIVDKFLESVLADRPSNDEVSSAIGHMILNFMMTNEKDRLRAVEIKSLIKSIAEKAHQPNSSSYEAQVAKIHESRIQQSLSATITSSSDDGTSDTSSLCIWSEPEYMAGATLLSSAPDTQNLVSNQGGHGSSPKIIDIYGYQIRAPHGDVQSEDQEEIQSLISLDEDIQSNQSGISSLRAYQVASKLLVERFLEDDHLLALYQEAVKRLDMKRFINNHTTLLKRYFLDLRAAVKSRTEEISVDFLRSQRERERISSVIYDLVLKQGEQVRQIVKMEIKDNQESFRLVDRFLAEQEDYDHEDTTYSDPESSDSSDDPPSPKEQTSQGESSKLEAVATFMTVGSAFESYKYNLDEFLHPRKRGDKDPSIILAETSPTALTTSQYARKIARGFSWLMKITRPRVKKGYRRLEWTCVSIA
ncbi:hypothetical protein SNK03_002775 [Fusarium graminearum]